MYQSLLLVVASDTETLNCAENGKSTCSGGLRVLCQRESGTGHPMATAAPELDPTADDPTNSKVFFYKRDVIQAS